MTNYSVTNPTNIEKMLFDAGLVTLVDLRVIYDIKAGTTAQRSWQRPDVCRRQPDVHDPAAWGDKLHSCIRGEFFAEAMLGCKKVLDVGCGEGFPSLYLSATVQQVVGIDVSPAHIGLARRTAQIMGLANVQFEEGTIENLPYRDCEFDGVCFGGNVFTYGYDVKRMLSEIHRVLMPGGPFAFEQRPGDLNGAPWERILWFIDGGPPIFHYGAGVGLQNREYYIYLMPESEHGRHVAELAKQVRDEHLTKDQMKAFQDVKAHIESGHLDAIQKVIWSGEGRSLAAEEFPTLLEGAGFTQVMSWALPNPVAFAKSLADQGALSHLEQPDLRPCIRALVRSTPAFPGWTHDCVTCKRRTETVEPAGAGDASQRA